MIKTLRNALAQSKERYTIPRQVQDIIPIRRIWDDGVFLVGNFYTKTYQFSDINYQVASAEDKSEMSKQFGAMLNSLDPGVFAKITINNRSFDRDNLEQNILMSMEGNQQDKYRDEYNKVLMEKTLSANGIIQEKYITISVCKANIEKARSYFSRIESSLAAQFAAMGSKCVALSTAQRLKILHDFYRPGEENDFHFDLKELVKKGHSFRDYICPDGVEKHGDYLAIGDKYCRVFFLKDYANYLKDVFVTEMTGLNRKLMLSVDILPIPMDEAVQEVERRLLGVESNITNWQRKQNENQNFSAVLPYDMEQQRIESRALLEEISVNDQRMFQGLLTMVLMADTKEELDSDTEYISSLARQRRCQMGVLRYQQLDGLQTVLPIGAHKIHVYRTMLTNSLCALNPFNVQEIQERGGLYFGQNAISGNLILCNKDNLMNQSAFLLGVSGSGKSFTAKTQIATLMLHPAYKDDDILICDPEGEFGPLVQRLGGEDSAVVRMAAGSPHRLNAMYMVDGYSESASTVEKSQFIMSLLEQIDKQCVGPGQKSIIDRCIEEIYREAAERGTTPTLCTLREKLLQQPEPMAQDIALSLELYTSGTLDLFGHESTVNLDKRTVVFDIHDLGPQLKPAGLLVITDTMLNRVSLNWRRGKRTHVFVDEFHVVFENEFSAAFFNSAWRQFRKRNACPTAITQNVEYLLDSVQASTMLSNSEFVVMLNQAASDRAQLAKLLNISNEQMSYVTNADPGCGLIKYGSALVPFVNHWPRETELYQLMTTKPGEGVFGAGAEGVRDGTH